MCCVSLRFACVFVFSFVSVYVLTHYKERQLEKQEKQEKEKVSTKPAHPTPYKDTYKDFDHLSTHGSSDKKFLKSRSSPNLHKKLFSSSGHVAATDHGNGDSKKLQSENNTQQQEQQTQTQHHHHSKIHMKHSGSGRSAFERKGSGAQLSASGPTAVVEKKQPGQLSISSPVVIKLAEESSDGH